MDDIITGYQPALFPPTGGDSALIRVDLTIFLGGRPGAAQFGQLIRTWPDGRWISSGGLHVRDGAELPNEVAHLSRVAMEAAMSVWSPF